MEQPVTAETRATVASVEAVSTAPLESTAQLSRLTELQVPLAETPETAATAEQLVRPEPVPVGPTVRADLVATRVWPETVASAALASRAPTELPLAIRAPRAVTVATAAQVALAVRVEPEPRRVSTPRVVTAATQGPAVTAVVV
jgi:hypothetical protein